MQTEITYPTAEHRDAADAIVSFFSKSDAVDAVLLVNSCARGKASRDSCLDIAVLAQPEILSKSEFRFATEWQEYHRTNEVFRLLRDVGRYSEVHLDFIDGQFEPGEREEVGEPDSFEIEVGNRLAYSRQLWKSSTYFSQLRNKWLPYYEGPLRQKRLVAARFYCLNDLDHIPLYVERKLYFQAFDRFQLAFKGFLQGLFIARRTYPIAYNKWIQEQIVEILELPELYACLPRFFEISDFESQELIDKADDLKQLVESYVVS